jgi:hypothetical protein
LSAFAGICDAADRHAQMGVISVGPNGELVEDVGTSLATPILSAVAANVWPELKTSPD